MLPGPRDDLVLCIQHHQLRVRFERGAVGDHLSNISNANTPGYARKIANVLTNSYGGSDVASVAREANSALLEQVNASTSQAASAQALANGLTTLAQTVSDSASSSSTSGSTQSGNSPSAMLANLQDALYDLRGVAERRFGRPG